MVSPQLEQRFYVSEQMQLGDIAAQKVIESCGRNNRILDIGGGSGRHSLFFAEHGNKVVFNDFFNPNLNHPSIEVDVGNFFLKNYSGFDVIWASHLLEHQPNPNAFLKKVADSCWDDGLIAITVPPLKHQIVSGHYNLYNAGLVLYQIVMAGMSARNAAILTYGYNISVLFRKQTIELPELKYDYGDLERLKEFFPKELEWDGDSFNGWIEELNWN